MSIYKKTSFHKNNIIHAPPLPTLVLLIVYGASGATTHSFPWCICNIVISFAILGGSPWTIQHCSKCARFPTRRRPHVADPQMELSYAHEFHMFQRPPRNIWNRYLTDILKWAQRVLGRRKSNSAAAKLGTSLTFDLQGKHITFVVLRSNRITFCHYQNSSTIAL